MIVKRTDFGSLCLVDLRGPLDLALLHEGELEHMATLSKIRSLTWSGGRIALRRALSDIGERCDAILPNDRGAPALPDNVTGSIAHKETVAAALARAVDTTHAYFKIGVDVEYDRPTRVDISSRVLTDRELEVVAAMSDEARARAVRIAFAMKEAVYKAIDPLCRRWVGFREVSLDLSECPPERTHDVSLALSPDPGLSNVRAAWVESRGPSGEPIIVAMACATRR